MGEILSYASASRRPLRKLIYKFFRDHWVSVLAGVLIGFVLWPAHSLVTDYYTVSPSKPVHFWRQLSLDRVHIVDQQGDKITCLLSGVDTHNYVRICLRDLTASESEERRLWVSQLATGSPDDRALAFLRGFTGQDFGNDADAWRAWLKEHDNASEPPIVIYHRILTEMDHWRNSLGIRSVSKEREAAASALYNQEVTAYFRTHWKEQLTILFCLVVITSARAFDRRWKRKQLLNAATA